MVDYIERDAVLALQPYDYDGDPCGKWDIPVFLKRSDLFALPAIAPAQIRSVSEADRIAIRNDALREAAEICAGIRKRIANGPMPEGARFDYEQEILALIDQPALSPIPVDANPEADTVAKQTRDQIIADTEYAETIIGREALDEHQANLIKEGQG